MAITRNQATITLLPWCLDENNVGTWNAQLDEIPIYPNQPSSQAPNDPTYRSSYIVAIDSPERRVSREQRNTKSGTNRHRANRHPLGLTFNRVTIYFQTAMQNLPSPGAPSGTPPLMLWRLFLGTENARSLVAAGTYGTNTWAGLNLGGLFLQFTGIEATHVELQTVSQSLDQNDLYMASMAIILGQTGDSGRPTAVVDNAPGINNGKGTITYLVPGSVPV